jgi:L-2-hydroxycarboxylate dehydrogenase (NAD+)
MELPRTKMHALTGFITRVLESVGIPHGDAGRVAALIAEADARGADGHGVFRLPQYVKRIQSGGINTRPNVRVIREQPATALLEGPDGRCRLGGSPQQQSRRTGIALCANAAGS